LQKTFQRLGHRGPRAAREYPCFRRAVDMVSMAISGLNIVPPIFRFSLSIMMLAAAVALSVEAHTGRR
jgi:hypothetical protein